MVLDMLRLFQALIVKMIFSSGFRYAVSWSRLFTSSARNFVFSKIVSSGRKLIVVPVFSFPDRGQQALLQFDHRDPPLIPVMMDVSFQADLDIHISGQRVHHRGAHAVESAACLIGGIIELSACMECGKYKSGS